MFKHELGSKARDRVTGLVGIITGRYEYLYGCRRYSVQPIELKDGKPVDPSSFDEDGLEIVEAAEPYALKDTGGPQRDPAPRKDPTR